LFAQFPAPSQAMFDPQGVPAPAGDWLHIEPWVPQAIVPGLQVDPHVAPGWQADIAPPMPPLPREPPFPDCPDAPPDPDIAAPAPPA